MANDNVNIYNDNVNMEHEIQMISEKDVQTYQRDGVIVVPEVLGTDTLSQVRSVIAELVAGSAQTLEHTDVYDLEPGHTAENPRVRRIKAPHKVHKIFDEIVRSEPVLDILKKLLGPGLRLHGSKLNMKSAQYGSPVEWHQDWAFYPHTNDDLLAVGMMLDDAFIENGPLLVVPAGDIAHVYSTQVPYPLREPELRVRHAGLLERCAKSPAVGFTLVRGEKGPLALRGERRLELDRPQDALEMAHGVGHPLAAVYARDLLRMRSAGDVILLGTAAPCGETVAYPFEFGSHGGLAPEQLDTFVIHPEELGEGAFASVVRPQDLHRFFLERSGRPFRQLSRDAREEAPCAS